MHPHGDAMLVWCIPSLGTGAETTTEASEEKNESGSSAC